MVDLGGCSRLGVGGLGCRLETFLTLLRTYAFPFYPFFLFNDYSFFIIYVYMPAFLFFFSSLFDVFSFFLSFLLNRLLGVGWLGDAYSFCLRSFLIFSLSPPLETV